MRTGRQVQVIGIASGKGGVGKTTVSVNLAACLAQQGHRVMLLDADLGLANAQLALGSQASYNIGHVLRGEKSLQEIIVSPAKNLRLVPGASGVRELAALGVAEVNAIVRLFDELTEPVDFFLVDIAAGISPAVIAFLSACQRSFVVMCDQPASIADAYGLIKILSIEEGLDEIYLLPNMVESQSHGQRLHARLNEVTQRFLGGVRVGYLTSIESDELIVDAQSSYRPVTEFAPGSTGARDFRRLASQVAALPEARTALTGRLQFLLSQLVQPGLDRV